jgi:drug/metabolite transporter (DMT)-like permease
MDRTKLSYIYAGLTILFWSTVPTAFKISLGQLDILPMLTIATLTSTLVLLIVVLADNKGNLIIKSSARDLAGSALFGFINPFIYYFILLNAYQLLPAQVAQPLNMIWPIILVFLSVPILKQKIKRKSFIALLISFSGVYIISSRGELFNHVNSDIGVLLAIGSSVFFALYFILNVKDKRDEAVKLFLSFFFGSLYLLVTMIVTGKWQTGVGVKGLLASVYIGLFEMGISYFFWLKALKLAPTTDKVGNLVYVTPFFSLLFIHYILHESVYLTTLAGLLLILSGIWIQNHKFCKRINNYL